jgi:hypothetical protein
MADPRAAVIDSYFETNYNDLFGPYNVPVGQVILDKAEKYVVRPSTVAAVVEKESGGRDIFGCDLGDRDTAPWCRQRVTRERLDGLIRWVRDGGDSNGVGWTQLTYFPFIEMAEDRGGAHLPEPNIDVSVEELKRLFVRYDNGTPAGWRAALASYNGGESTRFAPIPQAYAFDVEKKAAAWAERLAIAGDGAVRDGPGNGGEINKGLMSNVAKVKEYGLTLLNGHHPKYWCWDGGSLDRTVAGRPGCKDGPPPPMAQIDKMFCADLLSLQLRHVGKPVPKNHIWPGGTRSFKLRYGSVVRPMRLSELQEGDVPFVDFETPWAREGHIAFCLGNGPNARLLQSFARSCSTLEPGLNADFTVAQSHDGGYYTHYIPREKIWD